MKKIGLILVIILLAGIIATYSIWNSPEPGVRLIQFKGVGQTADLEKSGYTYTTLMNSDSIVSFPTMGNDLVYGNSKGKQELVYRLKDNENNLLKFKVDSLGSYLENQLISLKLSDDNGSVNWLNKSSVRELDLLQSVVVEDSISENCLQSLQKLEKSTTAKGLVLSTNIYYSKEIIQIVKPQWLSIQSNGFDSAAYNEIYRQDRLEILNCLDSLPDMGQLARLSKLNTLLVNEIDSYPYQKMSQLPQTITTFSIVDSNIKDLNFLEGCPQLKELNLNGCGNFDNLEPLRKLTRLQSLSLIKCDSIADLTPLSGLKNLKWLAPPWNVNEQQLASIVKNSPQIESLVLFNCKYLKSLHSLKDLHRLSYLSIVKTPISPDSLVGFQDLKYLAFNSGLDSDSLNIIRLQKQMPRTLVVPVEPFCMGTGWLLLFFGLLISVALILFGVKKRFHA